ncbi:unnamed protein product, partial [Rotaria magnacalcarata]
AVDNLADAENLTAAEEEEQKKREEEKLGEEKKQNGDVPGGDQASTGTPGAGKTRIKLID